jgi:hypothetical protein
MSSHSSFLHEEEKHDMVHHLPIAKATSSDLFLKRSTTIMKSNIDLENSSSIKGDSDDTIRLMLCNLCKNVLVRPKVCSSCHIASCEMCLEDWGREHPRCPSGCDTFEYTQPSQFLESHLRSLKVK